MTGIFSELEKNCLSESLIQSDRASNPAYYGNIAAACQRGTDFRHEWKLGVTVEEIQIYINKNVN